MINSLEERIRVPPVLNRKVGKVLDVLAYGGKHARSCSHEWNPVSILLPFFDDCSTWNNPLRSLAYCADCST
jgi:hypothetical protein